MKIGFTLNGAPVCVEAPGTVSLLTCCGTTAA